MAASLASYVIDSGKPNLFLPKCNAMQRLQKTPLAMLDSFPLFLLHDVRHQLHPPLVCRLLRPGFSGPGATEPTPTLLPIPLARAVLPVPRRSRPSRRLGVGVVEAELEAEIAPGIRLLRPPRRVLCVRGKRDLLVALVPVLAVVLEELGMAMLPDTDTFVMDARPRKLSREARDWWPRLGAEPGSLVIMGDVNLESADTGVPSLLMGLWKLAGVSDAREFLLDNGWKCSDMSLTLSALRESK